MCIAGAARAQEMPTVTVTAAPAPVVRKLDKTVVDVASMPRAANGTAQDVLQATPELSVAADGSIAVKGNANVTVLVDGKPMALLAGSNDERAMALQTMRGADIASIEVITNPSAAYSANGGAIVNIVLKRNRKPGAHGQLQASASDHGLWNGGASGDAGNTLFSVHGNLAVRHDGTEKIRASSIDWQGGHTRQQSTVFVHRIVESAGLGLDVMLSGTDSVSLATRHAARRSRPLFDVLNWADGTLYHRISEGPNEQADDSVSVTFNRQQPGGALKAMLQRSNTRGLVDKSYRDVFIDSTAFSHGATRSARRLDQATVDWTRGPWGVGVDAQDKAEQLDNYQAAIDPATGAATIDAATSNRYAMKTTVRAAYLTYLVREGKWEALLGGRFERTTMQAAHWNAVNPSLHLLYATSNATDITLTYLRSLQLPDPRDLNPATTYIDAQNLSRGNSALQPQRLGSWELGADTSAGPWRRSIAAFYRRSTNAVIDARSVLDNVLLTSKQNGGEATSAGLTSSLEWGPAGGKLRLGMDGGVVQVRLQTPDESGVVRQQRPTGYVNVRAAMGELALDAHVQSAGITPLGRFGSTSSVNLGWKRSLSRTLTLTINANDVFDGSRRTYATDAALWRQSGFDHFVARRLAIGLVQAVD